MEIKLKQADIETALRSYLEDNGIGIDGKDVSFSFSQRRQPTSELIADVDISPAGTAAPTPEAPQEPRAARKPRKPAKAQDKASAAPEPTPEASSDPDEGDTGSEPVDPPGDPAVGTTTEAANEEAPAEASTKVSLFG